MIEEKSFNVPQEAAVHLLESGSASRPRITDEERDALGLEKGIMKCHFPSEVIVKGFWNSSDEDYPRKSTK